IEPKGTKGFRTKVAGGTFEARDQAGNYYLIADGQRYEIDVADSLDSLLSNAEDLGLGSTADVPVVSAAWLNLFPAGTTINSAAVAVPHAGEQPASPVTISGKSLTVGQVLTVPDQATGKPVYEMVTASGKLFIMKKVEYDLFASVNQDAAWYQPPVQASTGTAGAYGTAPKSEDPFHGDTWPGLAGGTTGFPKSFGFDQDTPPCAALTTDQATGRPTTRLDKAVDRRTGAEAQAGSEIAKGYGAVVRSGQATSDTPGQQANAGTTYLVYTGATQGTSVTAYAIEASTGSQAVSLSATVQRLGYQNKDIHTVTPAWVALLDAGPTLSVEAAEKGLDSSLVADAGSSPSQSTSPSASPSAAAGAHGAAYRVPDADSRLGRVGSARYVAGSGGVEAAGYARDASGMASPSPSASAGDQQSCSAASPMVFTSPFPYEEALQFQEANTLADGSGVTVAVLDSGVEYDNPHFCTKYAASGVCLTSTVKSGSDAFQSEDPHGYGPGLEDPNGHGTGVGGLIGAHPAASDQNVPASLAPMVNSSVEGLAPGVTILSYRIEDAKGDLVDPGTMANAVNAAVAAHAQILNISFSIPYVYSPSAAGGMAKLQAAIEDAYKSGALVIASTSPPGGSGNGASPGPTSSEDPTGERVFPAAYPDVLGVTAVTSTFAASNDVYHSQDVDIAAPGEFLPTTAGLGDCIQSTNGKAETSYATPIVTAAAALLAEKYPKEGPAGWAYRLEASAQRPKANARDDATGWGVVQPYAALTLSIGPDVQGPTPIPAAVLADQGSGAPHAAGSSVSFAGTLASPMPTIRTVGGVAAVGAAAVVVLGLTFSRLRGRKGRRRPPSHA
ncbi:MAG: S8 family serine peptidase, partial [Bifidobacteriaceae bacterium]|nr:S8 family serine peptidase [Bifidobacteriaceae bacterium]